LARPPAGCLPRLCLRKPVHRQRSRAEHSLRHPPHPGASPLPPPLPPPRPTDFLLNFAGYIWTRANILLQETHTRNPPSLTLRYCRACALASWKRWRSLCSAARSPPTAPAPRSRSAAPNAGKCILFATQLL
jgi:hypothetical protein